MRLRLALLLIRMGSRLLSWGSWVSPVPVTFDLHQHWHANPKAWATIHHYVVGPTIGVDPG